MEAEIAKVRRAKSAQDAARASLRAVGAGYLRFAFTETGLFRTAFATPELLGFTGDPARKGKSGLDPFELREVVFLVLCDRELGWAISPP